MNQLFKRTTATLLAAALLAVNLPLSALAAPAEITGEITATPTEITEPLAAEGETPADETEAPADETETPANETEASADETETPADELEIPANETEASADETETPADELEIPAAPEAAPITLAEEGEPASLPVEPVSYSPEGIPGYNFNWADDGDTHDAGPEICYYTDDYFKAPATDYNPKLAGASMCLTMASFGSVQLGANKDLTLQSQNAKKLLADLGFSSPEDNPAFREAPTITSIGCVAAYKIVKDAAGNDIPLIAVGVRGSNYKSEWASNVTIGADGNHNGFQSAADQVLKFVEGYLTRHATELAAYPSVKFWVTGFSRAAATSNLTAATLNQDIQDNADHSTRIGKKIESIDDVYAYTFETPAGKLTTVGDMRDYSNIFNIINPQDLVPMVAPVSLDFKRYGVDKFLPAKESHPDYATLNAAVKLQAAAHNRTIAFELLERMMIYPDTTRYDIYSAVYPSQSLFFADFVANLAEDGVGTREAYLAGDPDSLQAAMIDLMGTFMKDDTVPMSEFGSMFVGMLNLKYAKKVGGILKKLAGGDKTAAYQKLRDWMVGGAQDKGATHIDAALIDSLSTDLMQVLGLFGRMLGGSAFLLPSLVTNEMIAMKLISNNGSEHVSTGHSVALCKAWLETMDPNYTNTAKNPDEVFTTGEYRRISLSRAYISQYGTDSDADAEADTPLNITVTDDATGDRWTFTEDGLLTEGEDTANSPALMTFGTEGSSCMSVLYLPCTRAYTVEAWQTHRLDNSVVCIKVEEFTPALPKEKHVGQVKREVVWYNHPGTNAFGARKYTLAVPAYTDDDLGNTAGSDCAYTVDRYNINSGTHQALTPSNDRKREPLVTMAANDDNFVELGISVTPRDECGYAGEQGKSIHLVPSAVGTGDQAFLYATPTEGYRFVGWYQGGTLLSKEANYTYAITDPADGGTLALEARFAKVVTPEPDPTPAPTAAPAAEAEAASTDLPAPYTAGRIPQTGDEAPLALWVVLGVVSLGGAVVLGRRKRRSER